MIALEEFMGRNSGGFKTEPIRAIIKGRFDAIGEATMKRFRDGDYGGRGRTPADSTEWARSVPDRQPGAVCKTSVAGSTAVAHMQ